MLDAAQIAGLNCLRLMNETTAGWFWVEESGHRLLQVPAGFGSRCRNNK